MAILTVALCDKLFFANLIEKVGSSVSVEWDLNNISQSFANAALGHDTWQSSLDVISEKVGAIGATLIPIKGSLPELPTSSTFKDAIDHYLKDGWNKNDVRFLGVGTMRRKGFVTDLDFMSEDSIRRSPYYQEWLRPFGLKWFAGVHIAGPEEDWVLSLQRSEAQGPFTAEEGELLVKVARSFSSSASLANALGFSRADAALEAFTLSGKAVVMLNRYGEVVRTNNAAERIFNNNLCVRGKRLTSSNQDSNRKLDHAIHTACTTPQDCFNTPVLLKRTNEGPIVAFVSPAHGVANDVLSPCRAYAILVDPYHREKPSMLVLQNLFGLTRAEATLAVKLGHGDSLRDLASAMGISYETGRTHLRSIFSKLGVNDQADLVAFLLNLEIGAK